MASHRPDNIGSNVANPDLQTAEALSVKHTERGLRL